MTKKQEEAKLKKKQETEELHEWFQQLWEKLPKKKKCQSCGAPIWGENRSYYWDHLLEKNKYPECRMEEWCLYFCCFTCHSLKTNGFPTKNHKKAIQEAKNKYQEIFGNV